MSQKRSKQNRIPKNFRLDPLLVKAIQLKAELTGMNERQVLEKLISEGLREEIQIIKDSDMYSKKKEEVVLS